jgi:hypothetical protein
MLKLQLFRALKTIPNKHSVFLGLALGYYLLAITSYALTRQYWLIAYFLVGQLGGHVFAGTLYSFAKNEKQSWSSLLTGVIERTFFFVVVATDVSGAAISMMAWVTLKNLAYIGRFFQDEGSSVASTELIKRQNLTLLSSLLSLFFAMIAGLCVKSGEIRNAIEPVLKTLTFL